MAERKALDLAPTKGFCWFWTLLVKGPITDKRIDMARVQGYFLTKTVMINVDSKQQGGYMGVSMFCVFENCRSGTGRAPMDILMPGGEAITQDEAMRRIMLIGDGSMKDKRKLSEGILYKIESYVSPQIWKFTAADSKGQPVNAAAFGICKMLFVEFTEHQSDGDSGKSWWDSERRKLTMFMPSMRKKEAASIALTIEHIDEVLAGNDLTPEYTRAICATLDTIETVADADALMDSLSITEAVPDDQSDADSMKSVAISRLREALA